MDMVSLAGFVTAARQSKRIRFGDVRRLARTVLPGGVTSRAEAELLLGLDRAVSKPDPAWAEFLIAAMRRFATEREEGRAEDGWLNAALGVRPTRTGQAILESLRLLAIEEGARRASAAHADEAPLTEEPGLAERELDPSAIPPTSWDGAGAETAPVEAGS